MIDIGGGSTEIVYGTTNAIEYQQSFPIGAVVTQERFQLTETISPETLDLLQRYARHYFKQLPILSKATVVLLAGDAATTLAALAQQLTTYNIWDFTLKIRPMVAPVENRTG